MQNREQAPQFNFSNSFKQTLKDYEQTSKASQADFERAQEWRENHEKETIIEMS